MMTDYIYRQNGEPVGFWKGEYIYNLNGKLIGELNGSHVYTLSGKYIGELYQDMVVDKHLNNPDKIGCSGNPGNVGSPGNPGNRSKVNYEYPDVWDKLVAN